MSFIIKQYNEYVYSVFEVTKQVFDNIPNRLVISPYLKDTKFMLGNEEEEEYLLKVGFPQVVTDYYKIICNDNSIYPE